MASLLSRSLLLVSIFSSVGLIYYVHNIQVKEQMRLHEGVIRDQERQRFKSMLASSEMDESK